MKKILLSALACMMLLTGCSKDYERDTNPGEIRYINYSEAQKMIKEKQTFLLILSLPGCSHCIDMEAMLEEYLQDHNVIVYNAALVDDNNLELTTEETKKEFPDYAGTPDINYMKDGKIKDHFSGFMSAEKFDEFVKDNQLDEKK